MGGIGQGFQKDGGGIRDLSDNLLILKRRGRVVGGHAACGHAFVGTARYDRRVGSLVVWDERSLRALYEDESGA